MKMPSSTILKYPFGEESCEAEITTLQKHYSDYFFTHTDFCSEALSPSTYLFVGRKGTGKTSLAHYFTFHKTSKVYECIDVDEPKVYHSVLHRISGALDNSTDVALTKVAAVWEYVIWMLIFAQYSDCDPAVHAAAVSDRSGTWSNLVRTLLRGLLGKFAGDKEGQLMDGLEEIVDEPTFNKAREAVLKHTAKKPVIIAIDSLEDYATDDHAMMLALSGLVECASRISRGYASEGIQLKVFVTAEIFPHLCEEYISNLLKHVRQPLFLHWGPKELTRLICWRFHTYLQATNQLLPISRGSIDWDSSKDVIEKMWTPYFGRSLSNGLGIEEKTLPYILRHTQLRPRQLIVLCNAIAAAAIKDGSFPKFSQNAIIQGVHSQEVNLAKEVLNSYKRVYPNVARIVSALTSLPVVFEGKQLDGVAKDTASQWPDGKYNLIAFRLMVAELGIVGRVRSEGKDGSLLGDFEYFMEDRLSIQPKDLCVIHPMFFNKFNIEMTRKVKVLPFPSKKEYEDLIPN